MKGYRVKSVFDKKSGKKNQDTRCMNMVRSILTYCPYCGQRITLLADDSVREQQYIEDCEVCCRPIEVHVTVDASGECQLEVHSENE
jgi:predicted amidophosphoribosyltransferase